MASFCFHPRAHAEQQPDKPALIMADTGQTLGYAELVRNADRAAQLFQRLGLRQGDTIALLLENHLRYPEICWAAKNSGLTYVCISSQSSVDDASYIVDNSDAQLLISSQHLSDLAVAVARRFGETLHCLMLDAAQPPFSAYETAIAAQPALPLIGRCRGPSMLYSSGTTGRPKGVRTPLPTDPPEVPPARLAMLREHYGLDAQTVLINPGPFYHAAPGRFMMSVLRTGGTVIGFQKFDAQACLAAMDRYGATHGVFVPTMFIRMLKLPEAEREAYRLDRLRCAIHLAAPCPIPVKQAMIDWWGPIIEEMYSGTEAIGHTLISSREWLQHKGSVGRPAQGCSLQIVDEEGRQLPPLQNGHIVMSNGRQFEYHKDPEKTRGAQLKPGFATLGDIGYVDADGYLYLTDRSAHMIVSGGVNIYPQEAENLLYEHPAVADVAVIGVPHEEFGEEVKALVQLRQGLVASPALASDIIAFCRTRLSAYKCPRSIDFLDELPRNEAGKLVKRLLKQRFWSGTGRVI